ncbi:hypothetical protein JCM10599A_02180 [Paraburkholderia kururiensis]
MLAKPMKPVAPIEIERGGAHERTHFTGRHATQQIHLEEAILRLHEAGRVSHVATVTACDGGHAECVALDGDGRGERCRAIGLPGAVKLRQARAQHEPARHRDARYEGCNEHDCSHERRAPARPTPTPHRRRIAPLRGRVEIGHRRARSERTKAAVKDPRAKA